VLSPRSAPRAGSTASPHASNLLNLGALVLLANVLSDATFARRFATWSVLALTVAALIGLVQVAACPGPEVTAHASTLVGKFLRKCSNWVVGGGDRARTARDPGRDGGGAAGGGAAEPARCERAGPDDRQCR
jgi:hypothetical protein